jgi:hypothetical protein
MLPRHTPFTSSGDDWLERCYAGSVLGYLENSGFQNVTTKPPAIMSVPPTTMGRLGNLRNAIRLITCHTMNSVANEDRCGGSSVLCVLLATKYYKAPSVCTLSSMPFLRL